MTASAVISLFCSFCQNYQHNAASSLKTKGRFSCQEKGLSV